MEGEVLIIGSVVLKTVIDIFSPLIPERARQYIPAFAVVLGIAWTFAFYENATAQIIYEGVLLGLGSVGVNEGTKIAKSVVKDSLHTESEPDELGQIH